MQRRSLWIPAGLVVIALPLVSCGQAVSANPNAQTDLPATVEPAAGATLSRITLTPKAAERIDIRTAPVREELVERAGMTSMRKVVPYAAVIYDADATTCVYTSSEPLVFVRYAVKIDYIDGDRAILADGPAPGTSVVTVGAVELLGTESKVAE